MNTRPRLLWSNFASISSRMSNKTKPPTHYETLEVNQRATQSEIKSAYFKLSKEYHPDKNSSEVATAKFRDIAEAYEILGNFQSRKMYDRSILTQSKYHGLHRTSQGDKKMQQRQGESAISREQQKSGSMPTMDFNAWTKEHYERTLYRTLKDRKESARKRDERADHSVSTSATVDFQTILMFLMIGTLIVVLGKKGTNYADPFLPTSKDVPSDERTREKTNVQDNGTSESLLTK